MTREEEIITASHNEKNYPCCIISDKTSHPIIFQIGAKWADQNPRKELWDAEKVINFLKERATLENSSNINIYISGATYHSINDFIDDLRKAMED